MVASTWSVSLFKITMSAMDPFFMVPRSFRPMDFAGSSDAHVKASGRESPPMLIRFLRPLSMVSTEPASVPFSNLAEVSSTIMVLFPEYTCLVSLNLLP